MKRIFFITAVLLLATFTQAQFNLGIKAGYNSSLTLDNLGSLGDGSYNFDNVKGEMFNNLQGGVFARVFIKKFYIQPEVLYSIQKKEYDMFDLLVSGDKVSTVANISNVEIPVFVGLKLLDLKIANLRVFAGPKFILDAGSSLQFNNLTDEQKITAAGLIEDFSKAKIDLEAGIGLDVLMFALDARLNLMQDVAGKIKSVDDIAKIPLPKSAFVISLGWKLF
jgi:hypothetical protein